MLLGSSSLGLLEHGGIRVEANNALEEGSEEQSDGARSAADVEETSAAVEREVLG
jgi:hypothetical protein